MQAPSTRGRFTMASRLSLALASMAVALFAANAQAALIAQWLLDENPITTDVTVASDTTGNWNGTYKDSAFFGAGDAISVTGHDGVPNSAVQFTKDQFVEIATPLDPNDPNVVGGIIPRDPSGFMYEMWFRLDGQATGSLFSENNPGSDGPNLITEFTGGGTCLADRIRPGWGVGVGWRCGRL